MQESITSSDDGSDEGSAGMGAPLMLPTYLRNILNTALDRLSIAVNNIDIEVEDQLPIDHPEATNPTQGSPVSLNFHIERIAIDSVETRDARVEVDSSTSQGTGSKLGKRRLHIQTICARLVSDAENFVSMSRVSQPPSPTITRSEMSTSHGSGHDPSASHISAQPPQNPNFTFDASLAEVHENVPGGVQEPTVSSPHASVADLHEQASVPVVASPSQHPQLSSSTHTVDDDRFADASSDDGFHDRYGESSISHSRDALPVRDLGGSSILYDDEGVLDYALENDMFHSRFEDNLDAHLPQDETDAWGLDGASYSQEQRGSASASEASISTLPTVSALGRSFRQPSTSAPPTAWRASEEVDAPTDNLATAQHQVAEDVETMHEAHSSPSSSPRPDQDLAESQLFTHDEAESMYMSAVSAAQTDSMHRPHVPGGWDSSSTSSKSTTSEDSTPVPEEMMAGSILAPLPEVEDGCETPRPASPQSVAPSPHPDRTRTPTGLSAFCKQAKLFLTIDEVTVWFPLGLENESSNQQVPESTITPSGMDFKPPNIGEDSIFAEMPGSFSNYAHASTHRRKPSMEASARRHPMLKSERFEPTSKQSQEKRICSPSISIEVGSVATHMDLSTGRIMYGMLARVLDAIAGKPDTQAKEQKTSTKPEDTNSSFDISVKSLGVAWLETIMAESLLEGDIAFRKLALNPQDAIFRVNLEMIRLSNQSRLGEARAKLHIGKFVLASLDQTIIAFNTPRPRSRRSISVLPEQLNNDIEIDYEQAKDQRITIVTRPVEAMLDIQKLDDALSSFGGFSGVLELSSSISSANTIANSPVMSPARSRPRGVHFGDGPPPSAEKTVAEPSSPKIQVQFGEVAFTLKGRTCAVKLQTTSVRIAVRDSNVRLKVSEIHLSGPYTDSARTGAPLLVDVRGTTVNFLFAPEETDLGRLISLITPTKDPYENNDDILIETLLRQRRKGSVLRIEVSDVGIRISDLEQMKTFDALGAEIARLSKVTKYLPDDDRPGLLTLASVQRIEAGVAVNEQLGDVSISLQDASVAHVGVPALLAAEIGKATVSREAEVLVHNLINLRPQDQLPAIMIRMVGDEMEPVVKAKLFNVCVEYHVSTIMAALGLSEDGTVDQIALGIAASVTTIKGASSSPKSLSRQSSQASSLATPSVKPLQIDLLMRNCAIGLNPRKISSKGLFVLTEAHIAGKQVKSDYSVTLELRKASMHAIDDTARLDDEHEAAASTSAAVASRHLSELRELGFVSLSSISAAKVLVSIIGDGGSQPQLVDVEFKNELFVLESCADSADTNCYPEWVAASYASVDSREISHCCAITTDDGVIHGRCNGSTGRHWI
tara:strand:- start:11697 stop:15725 length:4029 start_codon:yes stop_codon:yes gene_type:complete